MSNELMAKVWLATSGLASDKRIASLASLLRARFNAGMNHRIKLKELEKSGQCLRCKTKDPINPIECELDAFDTYGLFCEPCRDENWILLRKSNERR